MNRGFRKYFNDGVRSAASAILKGGKIFKYYAYFFASLIGRLIPVLNTVFPVADVRLAKIVKEERQMPFCRAFGGVDKANPFGTAVLTFIIKYLIIIGGVLAIGALGAFLWLLGATIAEVTAISEPLVLELAFMLPAAIALVAYVMAMLIIYAPVAYIIDSNNNLRATEVLTASAETMRHNGKGTLFLNVFIPLLIKGVFCGIITAGFFGISLISEYELRVGLFIALAVISAVLFVLFAPVFTLATVIANNSLFGDIALDPASMSNSTKGVLIKRCTVNNALAAKGRDGNLESLFENAPSYRTAPPDTKYVPPTDRAEKLREYGGEPAPQSVRRPVYEPIYEPIYEPVEYEPVPEAQPEEVKPVPEVQPVEAEPVRQPEPAFEATPEPVEDEPAPEATPEPVEDEPAPEEKPEPVKEPDPAPEVQPQEQAPDEEASDEKPKKRIIKRKAGKE